MKRIALPVLTALALTACATSPLGRSQFLLMPADQMDQMGVAAYDQMKTEQKISTNSQQKRYVQCVADAVTAESGSDEQWEVTLFDDPAANAFALPGGKIGVYTGLLKVAKTQDQLAAVLGHEVGHVLAQHSNERMSIQYATETGTQLLAALAGDSGGAAQQGLMAALGLGTQVGVTLPFSRKHESEADIIGLQMMARAGFDPRQSVQLWKNMAAASNGSPPELLSTHPSSGTRIEDLEASMPEALPLYQQARAAGKRPNCG
ncbi:M48 family metallopeptidase [Alloalcanivorax xenomutans]|jgi:predicted Zn-dependent protease|uniref:M48 family metallopeptidase n=1 Tax=Alloalcanivorax xenomutans TaxID=1094342 RepID=A0A9Q3ZI10_9GAMM|nr:M48 family metallopeptidase [Alloalcanivorax xenomutans]ERS14115.1 peptidase [Alcanivorax sp. PN-3]KYZ87988.1 peptidase [Alcanivorax sp. KX64203]PHS60502.1 MAG: peptidase [Alcanivorax sp.]ARB45840.1 peptidase [Alloalcanivorax xenomutans]MCE7510137.1 M48 family metallopeptidase [Alloalcanivorax xenomutans]|eukprot:gnl/TRDRNA2_/TRDRNA2_174622_c0_seq3.p1 gnl/TRDRNA2_/TRDRNA2_174622_c0~~gnl/TRDRNA2_/TRDRNA2_174622_c0_seq3.p1  ORF type:complete len:262 (-),score=40.66 gnl/TRDRNA2_/TRDRNA2_174622_c0_seq3:30-815(-)